MFPWGSLTLSPACVCAPTGGGRRGRPRDLVLHFARQPSMKEEIISLMDACNGTPGSPLERVRRIGDPGSTPSGAKDGKRSREPRSPSASSPSATILCVGCIGRPAGASPRERVRRSGDGCSGGAASSAADALEPRPNAAAMSLTEASRGTGGGARLAACDVRAPRRDDGLGPSPTAKPIACPPGIMDGAGGAGMASPSAKPRERVRRIGSPPRAGRPRAAAAAAMAGCCASS